MAETAGNWGVTLRRALRQRRGPLQRGAGVRLLVDGPAILGAIEQSFRAAKKQILMETYMVSSDGTGTRFIDVLCEKARSGIDVWVTLDAIGSRELASADRRRLETSGVRLRIFNPFRMLRPLDTFFRTHRRIVVVDGEVGYVGGFGLTDEWMVAGDHGGPWHDFAWQVCGAPLRPMIEAFSKGWKKHAPTRLPVTDAQENLPYWAMSKAHFRSRQLRRTLLRLLTRAQHRAWICTPYFVPTLRLSLALRKAVSRGVDVRLMLPGRKADHKIVLYAGRRHYHPLLRAGVKIYETRDRMMHAKAGVMDDQIAVVGSSNLDNWSLHYNKEFNLAVVSPEAAGELVAAMADIQAGSTLITLKAWESRPWKNRVLERLFGVADEIL